MTMQLPMNTTTETIVQVYKGSKVTNRKATRAAKDTKSTTTTPEEGSRGPEKLASKTSPAAELAAATGPVAGSVLKLTFCALGIYVSFLTWALLQERLSSPPPTSLTPPLITPVVINTIQSLLAAGVGMIYLTYNRVSGHPSDLTQNPALFPLFKSWRLLAWVAVVAVTQSVSSPLGYLALEHVDYLTLILFKSCKLLPVMVVQKVLYKRGFVVYKYVVVALVTAGVILFTLSKPTKSTPISSSTNNNDNTAGGSQLYGLFLLFLGSILDGLTNSTQDQIFQSFPHFTGPHLMVLLNGVSTILTSIYLMFTPELSTFLTHIHSYPSSLYDVVLFALCGALGQIFIFITLGSFGSLTLVMVTVTRKMISMVLSVVWFGKILAWGQWTGVGLVFGGVGLEAAMKWKK